MRSMTAAQKTLPVIESGEKNGKEMQMSGWLCNRDPPRKKGRKTNKYDETAKVVPLQIIFLKLDFHSAFRYIVCLFLSFHLIIFRKLADFRGVFLKNKTELILDQTQRKTMNMEGEKNKCLKHSLCLKLTSYQVAVCVCIQMCVCVCVCSHRAVAQVSHVAGVAEQFSKHVRCGFLSALQHPHCLVTAASDTHTHTHTHTKQHKWHTQWVCVCVCASQDKSTAFVNRRKHLLSGSNMATRNIVSIL